MENIKFFVLITCVCTVLLCCGSPDNEMEQPVLASIDGFKLTLGEFETLLAEELKYNPEFTLTEGAKVEFLEQLIRKELLIQEAKKMKLDQQKRFIRTIERYWEATLIRDIMEIKVHEFEDRSYVTEAEVDIALEREFTSGPYSEDDKVNIIEKLKDDKKQALLKDYVDTLRSQADVKINEGLLK